MLQISRVDVVDDWTLDIELNNGHLILLDTKHLTGMDSVAKELSRFKFLPRPLSDGRNVYWKGGPTISLEDILHVTMSDTTSC